jgi:N-acetylmuramoyl-L-alanine amidase
MSALPIHRDHLPYASALASRSLDQIDLAVIHCTELPDLAMSRAFGERIQYAESGTGNSGHYYVEQSGRVEEWVPPDRVAHHVRGYNERSVGIELVNRGRFPDWFDSRRQTMSEPYPGEQIASLIALLALLQLRLPALRWIAGHEALDVSRVESSDQPSIRVCRKRDPGILFPWNKVLAAVALEWLPGAPRYSFD